MTDDTKARTIKDEFQMRVRAFWEIALDPGRERDALIDAADNVLLVRDALKKDTATELGEEDEKILTLEIADLRARLDKEDIVMNATPVVTTTGRTTYRLQNKPPDTVPMISDFGGM